MPSQVFCRKVANDLPKRALCVLRLPRSARAATGMPPDGPTAWLELRKERQQLLRVENM